MRYPQADSAQTQLVGAWMDGKSHRIREIWAQQPRTPGPGRHHESLPVADQIIATLLHRRFNHQSRGRHSHLLEGLRKRITECVCREQPVTLFFLYNGGYRASPFPDDLELAFTPDQTELMLIYQASLLHEKVVACHAPGIDFVIVVNNGVASWVNDIPVASTTSYASQLRAMIELLGATKGIRVLLQSELENFDHKRIDQQLPEPEHSGISDKEHLIVERFLGRRCSKREAIQRAALYRLAESFWGETLGAVANSEGAVMLRQVAHPGMLSFRPFPGGAIRTQNGSIGFQETEGNLIPKLVTSESFKSHNVKLASLSGPLFKAGPLNATPSAPNHA